MTNEEQERIARIRSEATGDPAKGIRPNRCYPDDVLFALEMIWELLKKIDELSKENARLKKSNDADIL